MTIGSPSSPTRTKVSAVFLKNEAHNKPSQVSATSNRVLVETLNGALNCIDFALLKVRLTALITDPGRDCVEHQVIAVAANMEGGFRVLHLPMTVDAVHGDQKTNQTLLVLCRR